MTQAVVTVSPGTPIDDARALMTGNRFSALPVVEEGNRLVGIVTTLDVLRAEVAGRPVRVREVMTREVVTMTPDTLLTIVAHRLRRYGELRAMPIVRRGVLVGIITRGDLLRTPERRSLLDRLLGTPDADLGTPPPDEPRVGRTAGDVMTPPGQCWVAREGMPVARAADCLATQRITALPVLDEDDRLLGVVSEADLLPDRFGGRRPAPATCGDAMSSPATAVRHDVGLPKVAKVMIRERFRSLPVLGDDGRVVGMVSRGDLLRAESPPAAAPSPETPVPGVPHPEVPS